MASTPHLILNAEDAAFFKEAVIDAKADAVATRPSHENIVAAKAYFREKLEEAAPAGATDARDKLLEWTDFVEKNAIVIVVDVADEADAFLIFETLNYRGIPLTVADLLKNYLFGLAGANLDAVQRSWASAVSTLESFDDPDLFVTFLRHYWISENGLVRERDLFRSLKARIKTADQVLTFAGKLEHAARNYAALLTPDHEAWTDLGFESRADVETLVRLRIEQNRPLLLAAMDRFDAGELKRLLTYIVSWSVRGVVVGGFGAGTTESAYAGAAQKVRDGAAANTAAVYYLLKEIVPSDSRFQSRFVDYRPPTNKIARYYLLALERYKLGDPEPEFVPNEDEEKVNLEHVFPRNAKPADWPAFKDLDAGEWSGRLGNLALLRKSKNAKIGNKPFTTKKPILAASEIVLTKMVGDQADWTPTEIEARQAELAALAVEVWPVEP